jgi:fatty-acyl-CoA synthase
LYKKHFKTLISTSVERGAMYRNPLAALLAVGAVAVVARPDDKWGEVPKAFVVMNDGAEVTAEEIIAFTRDRIAHFKAPKHVEFGELPKTATGKIQKYILREREWQGYEKRIADWLQRLRSPSNET